MHKRAAGVGSGGARRPWLVAVWLLIALALTTLTPTNAAAQQSVLRLGTESGINLNLILPVTLNDHTEATTDDKLYYFLDLNDNRIADNDSDALAHSQLDTLLNGGADTDVTQEGNHNGDDDARSVIVGDYTLVLPTLDELRALRTDAGGLRHPLGWVAFFYKAANRGSGTNQHIAFNFALSSSSTLSDTAQHVVAFQVIVRSPDSPPVPTGVTATPAPESLRVNWTPILDRNNGGAEITYTATAEATGQPIRTCTGNAAADTCTIMNLTGGVEYSVTVTATNSEGVAQSTAVTATPLALTVPAAPTGVTLTPEPAQIVVRWTPVPPANNGGAPVLTYTATATPAGTFTGETKTCLATGATAATCPITDLLNGTPYGVTVIATNSEGPSPLGRAANPTIPGVPTAAPTGVTLTPGDEQIMVTWETVSPANNGGDDITGYAVAAAVSNEEATRRGVQGGVRGRCTATAPATTCTLTGLDNGVAHSVSVRATNSRGNSIASAGVSATPVAPAIAQTSGLRLGTDSDSGINLNLLFPVTLNDDTPGTGDDKVYYYLDHDGDGSADSSDNTNHNSLEDLLNGGNDIVDTQTSGSGHDGSNDERSVIVGPYTLVLPTLAEMQALRTDRSNAVPTGWGTASYHTSTLVGTRHNVVFFNLPSTTVADGTGTRAAFQVIASTPTVPAAPTGVTAAYADATRLTINWTAVPDTSNGGAAITTYTATATTPFINNDTATCTATGTPAATTCTISGLTASGSYEVTVIATNSRGNSPPTTAVTAPVTFFGGTIDDQQYVTGQAVALTLPAAAGRGTIIYSLTRPGSTDVLPDGLSFDRSARTISGASTEAFGVPNGAELVYAATNPIIETATLTFSLTVAAAPVVSLVLTPDSISESGNNTSTITATLDTASAVDTTVTVTAPTGATADDYTLSDNTTLTIAAGNTTSTGTVTVTATDNDVDAPDATTTVSATATNAHAVTGPADVDLMITDDDEAPTVTLVLTPATISEDGGVSTVTAVLSHPSSEETSINVATSPASTGATSADFTQNGTTLTIAAGAITSTGEVTITANDNDNVGSPATKQVAVVGDATNTQIVTGPASVTLTIVDAPAVTLVLTPASISENGGTSTITAILSHASTADTTLTFTATPGTGTTAADYTLTGTTLTIATGNTTSTGTVTITAEDNNVDAPDKSVTLAATAANTSTEGVAAPADVTLTITDDEATPTVTLVLTPATISENGGMSTVTAVLDHASSAETTLDLLFSSGLNAVFGDYIATGSTLTIAAGDITSTGTVTITAVPNSTPNESKQVDLGSRITTNTHGINAPAIVTLTITDAPAVTLVLTPATITESGNNRSAITATLSRASTATTTLTITATPADTATTAADYTLSGTTLTIAAGTTASTGTVTITAADNAVDAPDKTVTLAATAENSSSEGVASPADVTLTIEDDEAEPTVTLVLTPATISEDGGRSTVTAMLSHPSSAATSLAVTVTPVLSTDATTIDATTGDYTVSSNTALTFAAGETTSTGEVTITAVDDNEDTPPESKEVTISATATNTQGITQPTDATLTIVDAPAVTLVLTPASISESGGGNRSTITATLDRASTADTTITVAAAPGDTGTAAADYALSGTTLTIAAGTTASTGTVRITAVDNGVDAPDKTVTVSGAADNGSSEGIASPAAVTLTIADDDDTPTVTLVLSPATISESGGGVSTFSTVTATLSHPSSAATTLTVTATPATGAAASDYTVSSNTDLTIAAGATDSTGTVTITAVDNAVDAPDKTITVSATAANTHTPAVANPADVTLTIADDDAMPTVTLVLTPASIAESGGSSTVTATIDRASAADTIVTVTAPTGDVAGDYTLSANATLTIAAGMTASTGTVTLTAEDNDVDAPDKASTVSATAANSHGVNAPAAVMLTITDDDATPTVTLVLDSATISESGTGNGSTITATMDRASGVDTTVTVTAPTGANVGDYTLSANTTLTIAAGTTASTGTVALAAIDNDVDAPDKTSTVSATAVNSHAVTGPADVTLTITDDDDAPTVTLVLTPASISEDGGESTVTATLSHPSSAATMLTVTATPAATVTPHIAATTGDYMLSGATLTIAAGATSSTGIVTITGVDDDDDSPPESKQVTISATATNTQGITQPTAATLTIVDAPVVTLVLTPATISENGGTTSSTITATLDRASTANTTITITAAAGADTATTTGATPADYTLSGTTLTIAAGTTVSTDTVTITAVDNAVDAPNKTVTVSATATNSSSEGVAPPSDVVLTITDDDDAPTVTLVLTPPTISESGDDGTTFSTVTATLSHPSSAATTLTVTATPDTATTTAADYTLSTNATLTFTAGATASTGTVTITAVDNAVDALNKTITVSADAVNTYSTDITPPADATLTIADDDQAPTVVRAIDQQTVFFMSEEPDGGTVTIELADYFEASGVLTYTATSVPPADIATVAIDTNSGMLTITSVAVGGGDITVTAADGVTGHKPAEQTFNVRIVEVTVDGATVSNTDGVLALDNVGGVAENDVRLTLPSGHAVTTITVMTYDPLADTVDPPNGVTFSGVAVDIALTPPTTSAPLPSPATICLPTTSVPDGRDPRLYHYDDTAGTWGDITDDVDTPDGFVCGTTATFSPFAVGSEEAFARLTAISEIILPEVARAMTDTTVRAITQRFDQARTDQQPDAGATAFTLGGQSTLADVLRTGGQALANGTLNMNNILGNSAFVLPLSSGGGLPDSLTLWGSGGYRSIGGAGGAMDWDGTLVNAHLGADARVHDNVLAGAAVSWSQGDFDYGALSDNAADRGGNYTIEMINVTPYTEWAVLPDDRLNLWGTAGYGFGDVTIADSLVEGTHTSDATLTTVGGGVSGQVLKHRLGQLRVKGEVMQTSLSVDGGGALAALDVEARRVRISLAGTTTHDLADGAHLTPTIEVGMRNDAGDGRTGTGAEVGGGVRYTAPVQGVTFESQSRILVGHTGDYDDWGIGGVLAWHPGQGGQGLALRLAPTYGQTTGQTAQLWDQGAMDLAGTDAATLGQRMDAEVGYGLPAMAGSLLTPYSKMTWGQGARAYRLGSRLTLASGLTMSFEGVRGETLGATAPAHHLQWQTGWRWLTASMQASGVERRMQLQAAWQW